MLSVDVSVTETVFLQVNATAYNELHAWKQKGIQRDFVQLMFESHDFLICRLCERFASRALDN